MDSSDEEGEIVPEIMHVSEYAVVDQNDEPISFAVLPLQWDDNQAIGDLQTHIFIHGNADNGLKKIYKQVVAWKFVLSFVQPEIMVLSKKKRWLTLQSPRKSFLDTIRTIMITIHWLHFMKRNAEAPEGSVWNHLQKVLSFYEFKPSQSDLLNHKLLIGEAVKRDKDLATSKNVLNILEMLEKNITSHQDAHMLEKNNFIVDGDVYEDYDGIGEVDGEDPSIFDPVCAICDNGGTILCCTGRCLRSFHPLKEDGIDSHCDSLGFRNRAQVDAIPSFLCKNCLYMQHQCYACGELGSSNTSFGQEVFPCVSATCGHFYHPTCVAKLLCPESEAEAETLKEKIAAGESFACPIHKCFVCNKGENAEVHDLQFAVCRRCPKAYHRKCLPKNICFQYDMYADALQRAWEELLPYNRILIYCMDHAIVRALGTPRRDHLIFPDNLEVKDKKQKQALLSYRGNNLDSKISKVSENLMASRNILKKPKFVQKGSADLQAGSSSKLTKNLSSRQEFSSLRKPKISIAGRKFLKQDASSGLDRSLAREKNTISQTKGNFKLKVTMQKRLNESGCKINNTNQKMNVTKKVESTRRSIEAEAEKTILALMEDVDSSFDTEEFMRRQQQISGAKACSSRTVVEKTITLGRVEASVKAIRTALEKLEAGASLDDAKAVCSPDVLKQIFKWKDNLAVYLGPFLHGKRYTSFGRHFTKAEKLKEIVGRLQWYVQDGDTIVDFCCGSNDFSCFLKEKLDEAGKACSFKNYDLFQPKKDFNFEKRDWMTVKLDELPDGSKLIMGLNPPFGVKAALANKFINKAMKFKPKLIILIVPSETRRLDETDAYDLIWEDDRILSGKSFYLPGSVDVNNQQMEQWNVRPPPLYLWSRRDWTGKHKAIAQEHGHVYKEADMNDAEDVGFNYLMEEKHDCYGDFSKEVNAFGGIASFFEGVPEVTGGFEPELGSLVNTDHMCVDMEISSPEN